MPQLDPVEYSRVSQIIDELADVIDYLDQGPRNFVRYQIVNKKQYGEAMLISPKQVAWLERLHQENVGTSDGPDPYDLGVERDDIQF